MLNRILFATSITGIMSHLPEILLLLFILNLGTAFGAGLYEMKIIVPLWFHKSAESGYQVNAEAMREIDPGRKLWAFVTTGPLTLITLANLIVVWQSQQPGHNWWLAAAIITLVERIGTFAFFIPTAIKLQKSNQFPTASAAHLVASWIGFNYIRIALTLIAWICALWAFSL